MNRRHPPRLAQWLLRRTGIAGNQSLVGDLLEEFDRGRSSSWFWRQTFVAVWFAFRSGLRVERLGLIPFCAGLFVETAVLIALRLFHIPFGLHSLPYAVAAFGSVGLAIYLDYRVRYYLWLHESELNDEESDLFWERRVWTRKTVFYAFGGYLGIDAVFGLVGIVPALRTSFSFLVVTHVLGIGLLVVWAALSAAGDAAGSDSENS